jgi:tetratricopeptide (TPR) repeat protein
MLNNVSKPFFIMAMMVMFLSACTTAPITQKPPVDSRDVPSRPQPETAKTQPEAPQSARPQALPSPPADSTSTDIPATKPAPTPSNPAVLALLSDAEKYQQQGNLSAAQSRIQRAQRIAPRDPKVYYQLAQTHYELEDYRLAEQVALKGVSYAQGDNAQLKRFWLLLVDIRKNVGDGAGAKAAREQASRY